MNKWQYVTVISILYASGVCHNMHSLEERALLSCDNCHDCVQRYTPVTLIPNQQESSRTSRNEEFSKFAPHWGGNFKPSHTRGGMSRNDGGMDIIYIFLDMQFGGVLNYVRTHSRANRDVPTEFEPHSSGNRKIPTTFELHSSWILVISK